MKFWAVWVGCGLAWMPWVLNGLWAFFGAASFNPGRNYERVLEGPMKEGWKDL